MKKILLVLVAFVIVMAANIGWAQQPTVSTSGGEARAAFSRVGQVETRVGQVETRVGQVETRVGQVERDLVTANGRVAQLATDLDTLKASRSASAGAIRRANEALAAAQGEVSALKADLVAEKHKAEVKEAKDEAGGKRLDKLLTAGAKGEVEKWGWLLPTEDPQTALVRRPCPDGTVPNYIKFGENVRYECAPLLKASDLTVPADSGDSYFTSCLAWAAGGAVLGSAANYGYGYHEDAAEAGWEDAVIGAGVGGGSAYVGCLAYHAIKGK